ncbi:MAG: integrase [Chloroflexi bacterium]|nr:integrase [Chloroflexota bacterium]
MSPMAISGSAPRSADGAAAVRDEATAGGPMLNSQTADAGDDWRLFRAGAFLASDPHGSDAPDEWGDLEEREDALGLEFGRPFLLRPDLSADINVLLYFASPRFRLLAPTSQLGYANNIRVFLSYLTSQGVEWREATEDHLLNYHYRRRQKPIKGQAVISGTAFARELAALTHFFVWQQESGAIQESPVKLRSYRRYDGTTGMTARLRPKDVRALDVKWLLPDTYRVWRQVGLGGYTRDGLPDRSWRGRNDGRNLAFADALWTSGLRRKEAGTLLLCELPAPRSDGTLSRGRVADAVAKGRARSFWISQAGLQAIDGYRESTRALSVLRAQAAGRYDQIRGRRIVRRVTASGQLRLEDEDGNITTESLDSLTAGDRQRLFIEGARGFEPAMLWLSESGMPLRFNTWKMVFHDANRRCEALGVGIRCYPHMLRHSFALR